MMLPRFAGRRVVAIGRTGEEELLLDIPKLGQVHGVALYGLP
jgi:hypothetical protein